MEKTIWDVAVIGGGPAGMMAAGRAAELGARVILIEKNDTLGKKLLITGGGRCNVTNAEFDTRKLLEKFKDASKFLFSAFAQYDVKQALGFFHGREMQTKVENEKRVFPVSEKAQSVWDVLVQYLKDGKVEVVSKSPVVDIITSADKKITGIKLKNKKIINARSIVIATGGTSRPETGSTGDAYAWLKKLGHTVTEPTPSLVPIALKDAWVKRLAGVSLPSVKITTLQNGAKQDMKKGKLLFTHVGVSGPTILNMSKDVGELLKYGEVVISLDLLPALDYSQLNTRLQQIFKDQDKKKFKNALSGLVPAALAPIIVELSQIDPDIQCNSVTREARLGLIKLLKDIPLHVSHLLGTDKAIITSGGVALEEVDWKTMSSKLYPNLYLVGDILDIDRPSGGYSLQLCWTTGFVAGTAAALVDHALVFGVFDGLHEGHKYFLKEAATKCHKLTVVLTPPEVVQKFKGKTPENSYETRAAAIKSLDDSWNIVPGDLKPGTWAVLKNNKPDLVILGHDQQGIAGELEKLGTPFIYVDAYFPEKYKTSLIRKA